MKMLKKLEAITTEADRRERRLESEKRRNRLRAAVIEFVINLPMRLIGTAVGFSVGCLVLIIVYALLQVLADVFGATRVGFRVPIAMLVLPLITAFLGFKLSVRK